jgi:hypothetical protein
MNFDQLESQVKAIIEEKLRNQTEKLQAICDLLHSEIPYYTWVGFLLCRCSFQNFTSRSPLPVCLLTTSQSLLVKGSVGK